VARYAEQIGKETQGNLAVIILAALLQDVGAPGARRPAWEILAQLNAPAPLVEKVTQVLEGLDGADNDDPSLAVVRDACRLAEISAKKRPPEEKPEPNAKGLESGWRTKAGKETAKKLLEAI
jgi:hypothetical protein